MAQRHPAQVFLGPLLWPLSLLYSLGMRIRALAYAHGLFSVSGVPVPCVSVGNISWGGTGKSPLVDELLHWAENAGLTAAVLTRGYGGEKCPESLLVTPDGEALTAAELSAKAAAPHNPLHYSADTLSSHPSVSSPFPTVSPVSPAFSGAGQPRRVADEPFMLARRHERARIVVDSRRARGAAMALDPALFPRRPDIFLLDDGFQHLAMGRSLNLVLLDRDDLPFRRPFGLSNWNRVLPLGTWREGASALRRADAFLLKCHPADWPALHPYAERRLKKYQRGAGRPLFVFTLAAWGLRNLANGVILDPKDFAGEPYALLCGVGNPGQVRRTAEDFLGYGPRQSLFFADHSDFSGAREEISRLCRRMPLVCTAKDAVKLADIPEASASTLAGLYCLEARPLFYDALFCGAPPESRADGTPAKILAENGEEALKDAAFSSLTAHLLETPADRWAEKLWWTWWESRWAKK